MSTKSNFSREFAIAASEHVAERDYWLQCLEGELPQSSFYGDYPYHHTDNIAYEQVALRFPQEINQRLRQLSNGSDQMLHTVLVAALSVLLSKYSESEDIIVGAPIYRQPNEDGLINTILPLRTNPGANTTFKELLIATRKTIIEAVKHQNYPMQILFEQLGFYRETHGRSIFDVAVLLENIHEISYLRPMKLNMIFIFQRDVEDIQGILQYNSGKFTPRTAQQIGGHFIYVLQQAIFQVDLRLETITVLSPVEKAELLDKLNDTAATYPAEKTIHQIFAEVAEKWPMRTAVTFDRQNLTYSELNIRSNRLAWYLRRRGVGTETLVGIMLDPSLETIISILGILKAGGAYLPIDPEHPEDRMLTILQDSHAQILVTTAEVLQKKSFDGVGRSRNSEDQASVVREQTAGIPQYSGEILLLDTLAECLKCEGTENLPEYNRSSNLAYVIYTSGTTGIPKGVMIEHYNVIRLMFNDCFLFDFSEKDVWTMFHSFAFDFSVWEMYGALLYGGKLVVLPKIVSRDSEAFLQILQEEKVTVLNQTPSAFYNLMKTEEKQATHDLSLRYVIFGGEALAPGKLANWCARSPHIHLINMYGITETTVHVTFKEIGTAEIEQNISNIGKPLPTLRTYILDRNLQLSPKGVPGELCVSGDGVARGYLRRPELTAEKFIENPHRAGEKMYRSGDLVRLLDNGDMEYLGRIDHQVKIRGFRIELGDIESKLLQHGRIKEAVVLDSEDSTGDRYLTAYLVAIEPLKAKELREYLADLLPDYMIPSFFILLDEIPLTANGKVNRKALLRTKVHLENDATYLQPTTPLERKLVEIWHEVLGSDVKIGVLDDFFELGGHSLRATTLANKIQKDLGVKVGIREVFRYRSIRGLVEYIEEAEKNTYVAIKASPVQEYYPLSSAQNRMFVVTQFGRDEITYNLPVVLRFEGKFEWDRLEFAFLELVKRHEALRTGFEILAGRPVQKIYDHVDFHVEYKTARENEIDCLIAEFVCPFALNHPPLFQVQVVTCTEQVGFLMLDQHHIISDGVSTSILVKEFAALYKGEALPELNLQYKDYVFWQHDMMESGNWQEVEQYWLKLYSSGVPVRNLPTDYPRPTVQTFVGASQKFTIDSELTRGLRSLVVKSGSTLYSVLLAVFNVLLYHYSSQEDIVVGSPVAGRIHPDTQGIVGMFVNTLALRNFPSGKQAFSAFLADVKENVLQAFEHQEYQFEELVKKLNLQRDTGRNPLFDTVLVLQNMEMTNEELTGVTLSPYPFFNPTAKFDLTVNVQETDPGIGVVIEYRTDLFKASTIERMFSHYLNIIRAVVKDFHILLQEIDLLSEPEKVELLYTFNDTHAVYPEFKLLHGIFEEQAVKYPCKVAVSCEGKEMTYENLHQQVNFLAWRLRELGVGRETIVGIMAERSPEMIVGILGILKAGGAYLPLEPDYPQERLEFMLKDSGASVLLTTRSLDQPIFDPTIRRVYFDDLDPTGVVIDPLENINQPNDMAYIIYTSGTSGRPKGVVIEHRNVVRLMFNDRFLFDFTSRDVWTIFHSFCFDFSVWEMYGALLYGGRLVIIPKMIARDPDQFLAILEREKVTVLNQTPSAFYNLASTEANRKEKRLDLRYVIFGGEALHPLKLRQWRDRYPETHLINMYGITETTVHVTFKEIGDEEIHSDISNIGQPIPTLRTYILNQNQKLLPIGVPGELCVAGGGVARGYLNRPGLTKERFIENPYRPGERLYRSGDLARRLENGEMEYLGRIDRQVKIRGYRIELKEIENCLLRSGMVKEAVVIDREDERGKYLCAYYSAEKGVSFGILREYLLSSLPEYMVPAYFISMETLPLTENGKVNTKALPVPMVGDLFEEEYVASTNELEDTLANIFAEILHIPKVGLNDNFFAIGGDSIKAIRLMNMINSELGLDLRIVDIYTHDTIRKLAGKINSGVSTSLDSDRVAARQQVLDLGARVLHSPEIPSGIEAVWPMSEIEIGMVFHSLLNPEEGLYHDQFVFPLKYSEFDPERFGRALDLLTRKHSILRATFQLEKFGEPVHLVYETMIPDLQYVDISGLRREEQEEEISSYMVADRHKSFDVSRPGLWRMRLFALGEDSFCLLFVFHHAILDGWSVASLMTELTQTYEQLRRDPMFQPGPLKSTYLDFLVEQIVEKNRPQAIEFWRKELEEYKRLDLLAWTEGMGKQRERKAYYCNPGNDFYERLRTTTKLRNISMKNICFSAYAYVLGMLAYEDDFVVGLVTNNRPLCADGDKILGCFLNTIPVRVQNFRTGTWAEYFQRMDGKLREVKTFDRMPLQEIVRIIGEKSDERNPLFDTLFNFVDFHIYNEVKQDESVQLEVHSFENTNTLLDLNVNTTFDTFRFYLSYSASMFTEETAEKFGQYFLSILEALLERPDEPLRNEALLRPWEKQMLLDTFNNTEWKFPEDKTIDQLFEEQVERTPERVAVIVGDREWSYREIDARANNLAQLLRAKGVGADSLVGIMVERSEKMIVGLLGILKAGGAYVPLNPEHPEERIKYMLADSSIQILLTHRQLATPLQLEGEIIDLGNANLCAGSGEKPWKVHQSRNLMYVLYTSGSTGQPKGVMIEHRSVVNRLNWLQREYPLAPDDRILQKTTYVFDVSVQELFWWFFAGAGVSFLPPGGEKDPQTIVETIVLHRVTAIHFVPSMLSVFLDYIQDMDNINRLSSLRLFLSSGEALGIAHREKFHTLFRGDSRPKLVNLYGPTEATIDVTHFLCPQDSKLSIIPIGKPIDNICLYIVNQQMQLQPLGAVGELCIAGVGLARGYLNRPELTAEKFTENPFSAGEKLYRTGDFARRWADGNIEFLGRMDHQVKIRGFRIEPGEIESELQNFCGVRQAVVLARGENDTTRLAAFFVADTAVELTALRAFLATKLPEYMVPTEFHQLETIPVTVNGKVDRKALLGMAGQNVFLTRSASPETETEKLVAKIWQELLDVEAPIGVDDSFFDLGGHSLTATKLAIRLHTKLQVNVPLSVIIQKPTVREQAKYIDSASKEVVRSINATPQKQYYPLSSAQKRIFILSQIEENSTTYNMPLAMRIKGKLDPVRVHSVLQRLIQRHESFRTSFAMVGAELAQRVHPYAEMELMLIEQREQSLEKIVVAFIQPFDLKQAPLLRVGLVPISDEEYLLMIDMHHIISDGVSLNILISDFFRLYSGEELEDLQIQYKDFAEWQKEFFASSDFQKQEDYWLTQFVGEIPRLDLPLDYRRAPQQTFSGKSLEFVISNELTKKLQLLVRNENITLNIAISALYLILLQRYSGQLDIVLGSLMAGRRQAEVERIIGVFVNFLPIRYQIHPEQSLLQFFATTRDTFVTAYENQDYPFDLLVEKVYAQRDVSHNPFFDTLINFHNEGESQINYQTAGLIFEEFQFERGVATLDLRLDVFLTKAGKLKCVFEYNTNLFQRKTIENLIRHFTVLIEQAMAQPERPVGEIPLLSEAEETALARRRIENQIANKRRLQIEIRSTFDASPMNNYIAWWGKQSHYELIVDVQVERQISRFLSRGYSGQADVHVYLIRLEDALPAGVNISEEETLQLLAFAAQNLLDIVQSRAGNTPILILQLPIDEEQLISDSLISAVLHHYHRLKNAVAEEQDVFYGDFSDIPELYAVEEVYKPERGPGDIAPFTQEFYAALGTMVARKIMAFGNYRFKVVVLDTDNTLWRGQCERDGFAGVEVSAPYRTLQKIILQKHTEGVQLAICSQNSLRAVQDVFMHNPDMMIVREDIDFFMTGTGTVCDRLTQLAREMEQELAHMIYITGNPEEYTAVSEAGLAINAVLLPEEPEEIPELLKHIWEFDRV